jgi:hypothetical protein
MNIKKILPLKKDECDRCNDDMDFLKPDCAAVDCKHVQKLKK